MWPDAALERVLSAAHAAPSVGHSQPWRFVVVRDAASREPAALMADRERLAQAVRLVGRGIGISGNSSWPHVRGPLVLW